MAIKEELTKRKKIIWLIIILLLLIIAVLIYLFLTYFRQSSEVKTNLNANLNQAGLPAQVPGPNVFNKPDLGVAAEIQGLNQGKAVSETEKQNVLFVASSFVERFGSYSNQSNYKNLDELNVFMTASMQNWIIRYKEDLKKQNPDINTYYALETKAISTQVRSLDEKAGRGEILVKTQRQEFKNSITNPRIFYQDILLNLVKVDNQWKINGAYWQ